MQCCWECQCCCLRAQQLVVDGKSHFESEAGPAALPLHRCACAVPERLGLRGPQVGGAPSALGSVDEGSAAIHARGIGRPTAVDPSSLLDHLADLHSSDLLMRDWQACGGPAGARCALLVSPLRTTQCSFFGACALQQTLAQRMMMSLSQRLAASGFYVASSARGSKSLPGIRQQNSCHTVCQGQEIQGHGRMAARLCVNRAAACHAAGLPLSSSGGAASAKGWRQQWDLRQGLSLPQHQQAVGSSGDHAGLPYALSLSSHASSHDAFPPAPEPAPQVGGGSSSCLLLRQLWGGHENLNRPPRKY